MEKYIFDYLKGGIFLDKAVLSKRTYTLGLVLKLGTILSCVIGLIFQVIEWNSVYIGPNSTLLYFTTQSNIWIAAICLVFLIIDIKAKGKREISNWLYIIKFMFTVAIMLTFIVFAVLLTPLQERNYLLSVTNICLHNITPIFGIADFIVCDYGFLSKKRYVLLGTILPLIYCIVTLLLSFSGVTYGEDSSGATRIVPYFFLDYKKLGWFSISDNGYGVLIWVLIITVLVLAMGAALLAISYLRGTRYMSKSQEQQ